MSKDRGRRKIAGISMAPMIDMVFLLLVFFMTASAMSQAGSKIELALAESPTSEVPKDLSHRLILSLDEAGNAYLGSRLLDEARQSQILEDFAASEPGGKLAIRAHRQTQYAVVKGLMRSAAEHGVESYVFSTFQGE